MVIQRQPALKKLFQLYRPRGKCMRGKKFLQVKSQAMVQVRGMWKALKPAQIKPHFETADIDSERATKRSRAV